MTTARVDFDFFKASRMSDDWRQKRKLYSGNSTSWTYPCEMWPKGIVFMCRFAGMLVQPEPCLYWNTTILSSNKKKHTLSINTFQLPHVVFSFVIEKKKVLFLHLNFLWSLVLLCASEYHMFTPHELFKTGQKFSIDSFNGCFADMACKRDISHFKEN